MRKLPFIVGIGHKARQGKTSLADSLCGEFTSNRWNARVYNFSDALSVHARCLGLMGEEKDSPVLQALGELYRMRDPNFWIMQLQFILQDQNPDIAIIAGVRHLNEFHWVNRHGIYVEVKRILPSGVQYIADDRPADHITETALDELSKEAALTLRIPDHENWKNVMKRDVKNLALLILDRMPR